MCLGAMSLFVIAQPKSIPEKSDLRADLVRKFQEVPNKL